MVFRGGLRRGLPSIPDASQPRKALDLEPPTSVNGIYPRDQAKTSILEVLASSWL